MATIKQRSTVPYYAAAGTWGLYAALFPLYKVGHFLLIAIISAIVFFVLDALCGTQTIEVPDKPKEEKPTGNAELDKMLKDGRLAVTEMKRLDDAIADAQISADIVRLEEVSQKIFERVKEEPAKLPQIRRFMDYFLPTTLKLLNAYDRASSAGISGENVDSTRTKVEGMMKTIVTAFEKQLDALYGAEAMDISTDITVLETMMEREGLSESGDVLHAESGTAAATMPETDIKLEL